MGTVVSFDVRDPGDHRQALDLAVRWFHAVDRRFSTYRADSEVSRYGRGERAAADCSPDLRAVIAACARMRVASGGAFDAGFAGGFDPSAYVKGWSVDRAGQILRAHGLRHWSINAGGDVLVTAPRDAAPWRIGVQHPFDRTALGKVLVAHDLAVATSARSERGDHLRDPRTSGAATTVASTTVCGPELATADALATAAFVLGTSGVAWVAGFPCYECWTVLPDGGTLATGGFPRSVHGVPVRSAPVDPLLETIR